MIFDLVVSMKRFSRTNHPVNPRLCFIIYSDYDFISLASGLYKYIDLCISLRWLSLFVSPQQACVLYQKYLIKMA